MEPYPPKYDTAAYIERHLRDANELALKLTTLYGADFYSFLYRSNLDNFIRHEILPQLARSPDGDVTFLDFNHWPQRHPFNFPGPFYSGISDTCGTGDTEAPDNLLYDGY